MPPTHLQLMRYSILARALMNGFQQLVYGWSSQQKAQVLSRSCAQNGAQIDHPKRIFWLLVAV